MNDKKIEFASSVRVETLRLEVDEVLRAMAYLFKEPDESEDDWLDFVFVSDESHLADFLSAESELGELRERLGMPEVRMQDSICDIAPALSRAKPGIESNEVLQ